MEKNIWIYAEHKNGKAADSYYELLTKAKIVGASMEGDVRISAVVLGQDMQEVVAELKVSGADNVYAISHSKLAGYHPDYYAQAVTSLVRKHDPDMFWVAASAEGAEIAPTVAAKLKTGLAAHCVDIYANEQGEIVHMVPAFGGKVLSEILVPNNRPKMASVKPGIFRKGDVVADGEAEVIWEEAAFLNYLESPIRLVGQEEVQIVGLPVEKADVVLSGGMGIGTQENWAKVKKLAAAIGAAVGYTRPVIDIELEKNAENMIGASGKSVRPKLYMAFGVSGASHHVCGMKDSGTIIAINKDETAEIFNASDYKVVADCNKVLDAMLKELGIS